MDTGDRWVGYRWIVDGSAMGHQWIIGRAVASDKMELLVRAEKVFNWKVFQLKGFPIDLFLRK